MANLAANVICSHMISEALLAVRGAKVLSHFIFFPGGLAVAGSDYEEVLQRRVRWKPNKVDPRNDTANDAPFIIVIVDDDIEEPTEYFEVYFTVETTGFAFPDSVARVTILDDDEGKCW